MQTGGCDDCPRPRLLPEALCGATAYEACRTQWRVGFGASSLAYEACIPTLELYLPRWKRDAPAESPWQTMDVPALMDQLRIVEAALLQAAAEQRDTPDEDTP